MGTNSTCTDQLRTQRDRQAGQAPVFGSDRYRDIVDHIAGWNDSLARRRLTTLRALASAVSAVERHDRALARLDAALRLK
jgi:hypothetical protein